MEELAQGPEAGSSSQRDFERHLLVCHYLATRAAFTAVPQLEELVAKLSTSLLRYTDALPADKAFFEAGTHCRVTLY